MTPSPLRQLSMRLASLCVDDRQWILSQLADNERHTITDLLAEIDDLGLLKDPSIGQAILAEPIVKPIRQANEAQKAIFMQLAHNSHAAWAALFLLGLDAVSREQLVGLPTNDTSVSQWLAKLSSANVPPALLKTFHELTTQQGYGYGN